MNPGIEAVWKRIRLHQGESFSTGTGGRFSYRIEGPTLMVDRTDYGVARSNFQRALEMLPLSGPEDLRSVVRGAAFVYAILHDDRIRQSDW